MKHLIALSHFTFVTIFALAGCSGDNNGEGAGVDQDTDRDTSESSLEQNSVRDEEPIGLEMASDLSAEQADVLQLDDGALRSDLEPVVTDSGWTLEEGRVYERKTDAVSDIAVQIDAELPRPAPSEVPRIYVQGPADVRVGEVAAASFELRLIDGQAYSRAEVGEWQSQLMTELLELGYLTFSVGTVIQGEELTEATVARGAGTPDSMDKILGALPGALRARTSIVLVNDVGTLAATAIAHQVTNTLATYPPCCAYNGVPNTGYRPNGQCIPRPPGALCTVGN